MSVSIEISYGQIVFEVCVEYSQRKTLGISVLPDCSVVAVAPENTSLELIQAKVKNRAHWIKKQVDYFGQFKPRTPPRQYVSNETHLYLGRQYRLKLVESSTSDLKLKGQFFLASSPEISPEKAKQLLSSWYTKKAASIFQRRLDLCIPRFPQASQPILRSKSLKRRWGSMSTDGILTLNSNLIRAPVECIDYVILHELCHIEHPHHGSEFWNLLSKKLPSWQKTKHKLELALK